MRTSLSTGLVLIGAMAHIAACSSSSAPTKGGEISSETGAGGAGTVTAPNGTPTPNPSVSPVPTAGNVSELPPAPVLPSTPPLDGDVDFSVPSGTFQGSLSVGLASALDAVELRYTTDGNVPAPNSALYTAPLTLDETTQLRAQAFSNGAPVGQLGTALYIARNLDATSDLPLVLIDGYGTGKPEDTEVYADMAFMVFEPNQGQSALSDPPRLASRGGYHLRGQSSATFEQAPYRVELWDNASEDADHPLLGMPAEADWALIGPYVDRSLIRNAFVYELGRDMGLPAPRYAFAEVYLNFADRPLQAIDYQGIYMVVETIKNHKDRLNLEQLESNDTSDVQITGGYIFKFDWAASEEPTLECSGSAPLGGGGFGPPMAGAPGGTCWTDLEVVDPQPLAPEQAAWLTDYVQTFHDALHESPFEQFRQFIDVRSFVDVFIINELTRNLDAYTRSAFYHKERNQPLAAGPLWDFNLTLGMGFGTNLEVEGFQFEDRRVASDWYRVLGVDPSFLAEVSVRWRELRQGVLSDAALAQRISTLAEPLTAAAARDFERWPVAQVLGDSFFEIPSEPTWQGQLQVMRDWLEQRSAWLDSQF